MATKSESYGIVLYGHSLGATIAANTTAEAPCSNGYVKGLVLECPMFNFGRMMETMQLPPFRFYEWPTDRFLANVRANVPVLILAAGEDKNVPSSHAKALYDTRMQHPKTVYHCFPRSGHLTIPMHPEYRKTMKSFLGSMN